MQPILQYTFDPLMGFLRLQNNYTHQSFSYFMFVEFVLQWVYLLSCLYFNECIFFLPLWLIFRVSELLWSSFTPSSSMIMNTCSLWPFQRSLYAVTCVDGVHFIDEDFRVLALWILQRSAVHHLTTIPWGQGWITYRQNEWLPSRGPKSSRLTANHLVLLNMINPRFDRNFQSWSKISWVLNLPSNGPNGPVLCKDKVLRV